MASLSYEARKRLFYTPQPLDIIYRCRRCGRQHILPLSVVTKLNYVFECASHYCNVTWAPARYNVVWRVLSAKGCNPSAWPEHLRYSQLHNYIHYHSQEHQLN